MAQVMIGLDPHKRSHTAVAVDDKEVEVDRFVVRSSQNQVDQLRGWADHLEVAAWAVESAAGLGYLVAQQLVAAGEDVVDVPPHLAARVRVLDSGSTDKTDRNDARSIAVCAWRSRHLNVVAPTDHSRVLGLVAKRHRDLGRHKTKQAGRLHALLLELVPGGLRGKATVASANALLEDVEPGTVVDVCRVEIASEYIADLATLDAQIRASKRRVTTAVDATGTTLRDLVGIGPIGAATILGAVNIARFETRDRFASYNGTAPIQASSASKTRVRVNTGGNRRINHVLHVAAINQLRRPGPGRTYFDRKLAEGKTSKEAIRALKRRISDAVWRQLRIDAQTT